MSKNVPASVQLSTTTKPCTTKPCTSPKPSTSNASFEVDSVDWFKSLTDVQVKEMFTTTPEELAEIMIDK